MDSFREPTRIDLVDLNSSLPRLVTGWLISRGPTADLVFCIAYVEFRVRDDEPTERHVVDRFVMPIDLVAPMRRQIVEIAGVCNVTMAS